MTRLSEIRERLKHRYDGEEAFEDFHNECEDDIAFLLSEIERKDKALAEIGNKAGAPTMGYAPEVENRERESALGWIFERVAAALRDGGSESDG